MSDAAWAAIAIVLAAAVTGFFALRAKRPETSASLIGDLMERQGKTEDRLDEVVRQADADRRDAQARERQILDYVEVLREHIREGKGPPPPAWPDELTRARGGPT